MKDINKIIAVSSGKGGVGKSLIASTLALALAQKGFKVGLFDLDFTSPSTHIILGIEDVHPKEEKGIIPPEVHGIKYMSIIYYSSDLAVPLRGFDRRQIHCARMRHVGAQLEIRVPGGHLVRGSVPRGRVYLPSLSSKLLLLLEARRLDVVRENMSPARRDEQRRFAKRRGSVDIGSCAACRPGEVAHAPQQKGAELAIAHQALDPI